MALGVAVVFGGDGMSQADSPTAARTWDWGDPEPQDVIAVEDYAECDPVWDDDTSRWGRTPGGEWKGYKNGGKVYLSWDELTRHWGRLTEIPR